MLAAAPLAASAASMLLSCADGSTAALRNLWRSASRALMRTALLSLDHVTLPALSCRTRRGCSSACSSCQPAGGAPFNW